MRLRNRGTESDVELSARLNRARAEIKFGDTSGAFDAVIINDDLEQAYCQLKELLLPVSVIIVYLVVKKIKKTFIPSYLVT